MAAGQRRISVIIETRGVAKAVADINRLNSVGGITGRVLSGVGRAFAAVGNAIWRYRYRIMAAVTAIGYFAQKTYGEFDDMMIRTKVALRTTTEELEKLRTKALDLAKTTPYAANETAEAMLALGRAGFDVTEVTKAITPVMNLAQVAQVELAEASDYTAHIIRQWSMDASKASHVADVLAMSEQLATGTITDLAEALQYVGPGAAQANISLEETSSMLLAMANAGIEGSMAGRALRTAFTRFERIKAGATTPLMRLAFNLLGRDVKAAVKEVQAGTMTFSDFISVLGKANAGLGTMSFIFEATASQALLALAQAQDRYKIFIDELVNSSGYAQRSAEEIANSFPQIVKAIKASLGALAIEMMQSIGPDIKTWLQTQFRPWVNDFIGIWKAAGPKISDKITAVWEQSLKPKLKSFVAGIVVVIKESLPVILPVVTEIGFAIGAGIWEGIKNAMSTPKSAAEVVAIAAGGIVGGVLAGPPGAVAGMTLLGPAMSNRAEELVNELGGPATTADTSKNPLKTGTIPSFIRNATAPDYSAAHAWVGTPGYQRQLPYQTLHASPLVSELTNAIEDNTTAVTDNTTATGNDGGSGGGWLADLIDGFDWSAVTSSAGGWLSGILLQSVTAPIEASLEKYLSPTADLIGDLADNLLGFLDIPMSVIDGALETLIWLTGGHAYNEGRYTSPGAYQYAGGGGGVSSSSSVHVENMNISGVKDGQDAGQKTVREIQSYNELNSRNNARGMQRGMVSREAMER